ncbi:HLH-domain-containing basic-leucine zipper transcription factor [Mucor lusitanicus CBS 277.49]|uniref:HLH-domain-containing basic-leucine zipper transcription factor n=1 Tax=Mucor lusitanicus CBS 277.49 TaxID=747725 RepID=A0A168J9D2_MUCCL|nr:HLH-domain-containing basic-leucine zipper transcription factor [Mucor lusitanicus CBS 277.49]
MSDISFEHFDPELELKNLDENGKPIKPRKKPGRKPNPPSPAQRKAQNRAAQRAFRERKRREMRDAETNIKKCIYMRDQAIKDAKQLRKKVDELRYENNFLKGQVLTLKIACVANRVDVPKFWDTGMRDKMGSDITTFSRTKDIPQSLEFFLDSKKCIVTMATENLAAYDMTPPQSVSSEIPMYHQGDQQHHNHANANANTSSNNNNSFLDQGMIDPLSPPDQSQQHQHQAPPANSAFGLDNLSNMIQSVSTEMDPGLMQFLMQPETMNEIMNQMKDVPPELWLSQVPPEFLPLIPAEIKSYLDHPEADLLDKLKAEFGLSGIASPPHPSDPMYHTASPPPLSASTSAPIPTSSASTSTTGIPPPPPLPPHASGGGTPNSTFKPEIPVEDDFWMDIKNPALPPNVSNKVYVAGPISPLDAVTQMRTMRDQNDNRYLLTPTELQRKIPHDPRIDLIPGPTMRDFMIIFQDFYDANELFNFLLESAMFIGGELGNPDCWFVPPNFIRKYWFLCPNYRPTRPDNSVELAVFFAQRMIDSLKRRKEMYIMRDKHMEYFLQPNLDMEDEDDEDSEDQQSAVFEQHDRIDMLVINNINKDIPRIISPNAFTV